LCDSTCLSLGRGDPLVGGGLRRLCGVLGNLARFVGGRGALLGCHGPLLAQAGLLLGTQLSGEGCVDLRGRLGDPGLHGGVVPVVVERVGGGGEQVGLRLGRNGGLPGGHRPLAHQLPNPALGSDVLGQCSGGRRDP
jgi:hypothetical protein